MTKITPLPGYILVEPKKLEKKTESGIVLPDSHEEKTQQGKVIAVGGTYISDYGTKKEAPCKVGDSVVYKEWGGSEYKDQDKDLMLLKYEDIMAIIH